MAKGENWGYSTSGKLHELQRTKVKYDVFAYNDVTREVYCTICPFSSSNPIKSQLTKHLKTELHKNRVNSGSKPMWTVASHKQPPQPMYHTTMERGACAYLTHYRHVAFKFTFDTDDFTPVREAIGYVKEWPKSLQSMLSKEHNPLGVIKPHYKKTVKEQLMKPGVTIVHCQPNDGLKVIHAHSRHAGVHRQARHLLHP